MRYRVFLLAVVLLALMVGTALARSTATSIDVPLPSSFDLSGAARATDNRTNELSPGPGSIALVRTGESLYLRVPAAARAGTRLAALSDPASGILFRNNTMQLPLPDSARTGTLIATTDGLAADGDAYVGLITGLELDTAKVATSRDGVNFTGGTAILLKDLPAGVAYRLTFGDGDGLPAEAAADLQAAGLKAAACSPALTISGDSPAAGDAVGYVGVTLKVGDDWPGRYGEKNVTFYGVTGGRLYRLSYNTVHSPDGGVTYTAMAPGTGTFVLVATTPRGPTALTRESSSPGTVAILGGTLAVLVIALAVMVRRVTRR